MTRLRRAGLAVLLGACRRVSTPPPVPAEAAAPSSAPPSSAEPAAARAEPAAPSRGSLRELVEAEDRTEDDRKTDQRRLPIEFLAFADVRPGMKVAEIGAGTGYTTELLARAVGPEGTVYGQNTPLILERFAAKGWNERLQRPVNRNVVRVDSEFETPLPDLEPLDRVVNVLFYHDMEWMKVDRAAHNEAVFEALRSGGRYVVIDHAAADGAGASAAESLHRIEEALVREEIDAAGFILDERGDAWANPDDTRDWNALPWRGGRDDSDKFALAFRKP